MATATATNQDLAERHAELEAAARDVMRYLAFMAGTRNRRYPFRPSPEGEEKLMALAAALKKG